MPSLSVIRCGLSFDFNINEGHLSCLDQPKLYNT